MEFPRQFGLVSVDGLNQSLVAPLQRLGFYGRAQFQEVKMTCILASIETISRFQYLTQKIAPLLLLAFKCEYGPRVSSIPVRAF
jgi:hypothetical protein